MPSLTIGILTLNEARRIRACLASAAFADQVLVVDSGSRDDTVAIARECGAQVEVYADWQGFAEQRNRLLRHATGDWVFFLDADEVITPELAQELQAVVAANQPAVWEVCWSQIAYGHSLARMRASGGIPRLFVRRLLAGFDGVVHEGARLTEPGLPVHRLKHRLLHYSRETVHDSLIKLAQYVQLGALKRAEAGKRGGVARGLASGLANFIRLYIFHRGFLCGRAGFLHCVFVGLECFFRYVALEVDRPHLTQAARRS